MKTIRVNGEDYEVVEDLGFSHTTGLYAAVVVFAGDERVAVSRQKRASADWLWWKPLVVAGSQITGQKVDSYVNQDKEIVRK